MKEMKEMEIKMNNDLIALQNKIFEQMEWIMDRDIKGDDLKEEIGRSLAFGDLAKIAVANANAMARCADLLYGIPVNPRVPLIPQSPAEIPLVSGKKRTELPLISRNIAV